MRCPSSPSWLSGVILLVVASACSAETPPELARWFAPQNWQRDGEGPIVSLGSRRAVRRHAHLRADGRTRTKSSRLWYSGSRGTPGQSRVSTGAWRRVRDGKRFEKHQNNPVLEFADAAHSVLTPALLRSGDGSVLREEGKLRMWFSSGHARQKRAAYAASVDRAATVFIGMSRRPCSRKMFIARRC
jgi:hypothetical protein